jgi:uncharacterized protein (DUF885 family)
MALALLPFREVFPSQQKSQLRSAMSALEFPGLVKEYIDDLHSRRPMLAAASGVHNWDGRLEDYSSGAIAAEVSAIRRFQERLEKIPPLELGLSDLFDYQIIASNMRSRLLELEQVKSYERNPQLYNDVLSTSLIQLAMFEYAPAETRLRNVIAKEKALPGFLETARSNVSNPPAVLIKIAIENFKGTLAFVKTDLPKAFSSVAGEKVQAEFKKATRLASDAIEQHIRHLERIKPERTAAFAIGKQNYEAKLKYDEGVDLPVSELLKIAYRELAKNQEAFRTAAARIDKARPALTIWAELQKDHPKEGTLVDEARKQLDSLARFIRRKELITLPGGADVTISESPEFMRWSTASMWTPGAFETRALPSRYMLTDVDPKWSASQKEEYLGSFNYAQLWTTSIHEVYPGHFVQGQFEKRVESSIRRTAAFAAGTFVEGWAHYTEQMMLDEGFGDDDPKLRMGQLADALLRLCRFVIGIRMHTEGLTVEQATVFFTQNAYMGQTPARLEAERGTFDPLYLVYSVGKLAILKLRDDYRRYRGEDFSMKEFHDRLLTTGNAPLWVHRQMLMPGDRGKLIE